MPTRRSFFAWLAGWLMSTVIPHTFGGRSGNVAASELDDNFSVLATAINSGNLAVLDVSPSASPTANLAAIQAAHDALPASGGVLWQTKYGIHVNGPLTITKPVLYLGPGRTEFSTPGVFGLYQDAAATLFNVTGKGPFGLSNLSSFLAANAVGVMLDGPAGTYNGCEACLLDAADFYGGAIHLDQRAALFTSVVHGRFWNATTAAFSLQNTLDPDQGDNVFFDNRILGPATATGLLWQSGGGLNVLKNKFLGLSVAIDVDVLGSTQDFMLVGNSLESFDDIGIRVRRSAGADTILYMQILGNQISRLLGGGGGAPNWGLAFDTNDATYVTDIIIADNFLSDVAVGILMNGGTRYRVHDNEFLRVNTGDAQAIKAEGAATTVHVGSNRYTAVTTPWAGTRLSEVILIDPGTSAAVADLPGVASGSLLYSGDALGPQDGGGYTGYGMTATGGGTGAQVRRQGGNWLA